MKLYDFIDKLLVIAERINYPFFKAKVEGNKLIEVLRLLTYPFKQAFFLGWNLFIALLLVIFLYSCVVVNTHDHVSQNLTERSIQNSEKFRDWYNARELEREKNGYYKNW